jgi:DNA polymerase-3 subunit epsilon
MRKIENEALDVDIMHRKLLDTNDKQFSLDQLFYSLQYTSERNLLPKMHINCVIIFKIKIKIIK